MIKLYHCEFARSFRALWTLEELGIEYELVNMIFPPRITFPGYLEINPLGTVPTLVDGPTTMTESAGICQYLAERHGRSSIGLAPNDPAYGEYLNWLHRSDATLTFPQTIVLRYSRLEPEDRRVPQVVADYTQWFFSRLRSVEAALEGKDYLVAQRFTVADIAVHYAILLAARLGFEDQFKPNCRRYFEALKRRPGYQRACERQVLD